MDRQESRMLRDLLEGTGWVERTSQFARALRTNTRSEGGLLLFGPPDDEPWHLTAHLRDEADYAQIPEIDPTLVRWDPPLGAPAHLSIGPERLAETRRGESLLVVSDTSTPPPMLERIDDVRRKGASVFALDTGDRELESLAREVLRVDIDDEPLMSFDGAQHLVSMAAGAPISPRDKGIRARLGRILNAISGPDT